MSPDETWSLSVILYICINFQSLHCSPQGRYFCTVERKSNQKRPFLPGKPKEVKITVSVSIYILTLYHFLLTFAVKTGLSLSVIFTFLLFSLKRLFSALLYLKQLFIWSDRYFTAVYRARLFLFLQCPLQLVGSSTVGVALWYFFKWFGDSFVWLFDKKLLRCGNCERRRVVAS